MVLAVGSGHVYLSEAFDCSVIPSVGLIVDGKKKLTHPTGETLCTLLTNHRTFSVCVICVIHPHPAGRITGIVDELMDSLCGLCG